MTTIYLIALGFFLLLVLTAVVVYLRILRKRNIAKKYEFASEVKILEKQKKRLSDINVRLSELKAALELEQEKSARLLSNILPDRVICDLRDKGESTPERFENVTVFFSDIVGFTEISSQVDPVDLIRELSCIFGEFDKIFSACKCERIKTVGDAYMAVAGMPVPDEHHYRNILLAALKARDFLNERNQKQDTVYKWQMRFGLHSGSVVGGIVGRDKYIYDIFGDTVNTASRMEHASEAMKINVSETTYKLACNEFDFTYRGVIETKGKGGMTMYFLNGEKVR